MSESFFSFYSLAFLRQKLPITSYYPKIMAFKIPFAPPKKFLLPEGPSLPKFFYDEVVGGKLCRGLFMSTYKAFFKDNIYSSTMLGKGKLVENENLPGLLTLRPCISL